MQNLLKMVKRFLLSITVLIMLNSNSFAIPVPVIAPDQLIVQIQQTSTAVTDTGLSLNSVTTGGQTNAIFGQGMTSVGDLQKGAEKAEKAKKKADKAKRRAEKIKKAKEKADKIKKKAEKAKRGYDQGKDAYDSAKKAKETGDISQLNLPTQNNVDDGEGAKRKIFSNRDKNKAERKLKRANKKLDKAMDNAQESKAEMDENPNKAKRKFNKAERKHEKAKKKHEKAKETLGLNTSSINVVETISFASAEEEASECVVPKVLLDLGLTKEMLEADDEVAEFITEKLVDDKKNARSEDVADIIHIYKTALKSEAGCAYGLGTKYRVEAFTYQERVEDFDKAAEGGTLTDVVSKLNMVDKEILDAFSRLVEIESSNMTLNSLKTLGVL